MIMIKNAYENISSVSTKLLVQEALRRGIKVDHINSYQKEMAFLELSYKRHSEHIIGQRSSKTSATAFYAEKNKALAKDLLSRAGINISEGKLFSKKNAGKIYKFVEKIKYPIVVKKNNGNHGELVFVGINNKRECKEAVKKVFRKNDYVLVEKEFKGKDFRIIATRKKFLAATHREPTNVVGDGIHTIKELIKIKNSNPLRGGDESPLVKIKTDNILRKNLAKQKLNLRSTPSKNKKIYLRKNANISTGGDSIDVTNQIHPEFKKIAVRAVRAIPGLAYGGVDIMTNKNISEKPTIKNYVLIEINASPGISIHHFPFKGKARNVAKGIIDILFPETESK